MTLKASLDELKPILIGNTDLLEALLLDPDISHDFIETVLHKKSYDHENGPIRRKTSGLTREVREKWSEALTAAISLGNAEDGQIFLKESGKLRGVKVGGKENTGKGSTVAFTAEQRKTLRITDSSKDPRFPKGAGLDGSIKWSALISIPLIEGEDEVIGVLELYKKKVGAVFREREEENLKLFLHWAISAIVTTQEKDTLIKSRRLNDFCLTVTKSIFQDIVSMDAVIMKVMNFAQKLVSAERASLFLVDGKSRELHARIFDVGTGEDEKQSLEGGKEIRFPMDKGVAGFVATTGTGLNIPDAYADDRFNPDVDTKTGYKTRSILCMPIFIRGQVIGVVQMVNKQEGIFLKEDEESFKTFAVYCGLALHHAKLYDKIRRSEQKYKVALEVLAYHSVATKDEVAKLKKTTLPPTIAEVERFDINPMGLTELQKPLYTLYMFRTLFPQWYEEDDVTRFILTVRKNYRRVAYHNWSHGWSVAQAMFVVLRREDQRFTTLEKLALFVAALCHDLDHRGKNNAYMKNNDTPLASIYSTSVMEHHHFNQTVTILQQDGHNVLKALSGTQYKMVLGLIKAAILATDLALFFPNKARATELMGSGGGIDWNNADHRLLVHSLTMTSCDLIASAKPWGVQLETAKIIFEEFYEQGDAEKAKGRKPIPMMDRNNAHELPQMQVGFMKGICVPCYSVMAQILPSTRPLMDYAKENMLKWAEMAESSQPKET